MLAKSSSEIGDTRNSGYSDSNTDEDDTSYINSLWSIHNTLNNIRGTMSNQRLELEGAKSDDSTGDETVLPPTYLVINLAPGIKETTAQWLIDKIKGKRRDGGAELIVMKQPYNPEEGYIFHISASKIKFLETAEEMEMIKEDRNGQMREFTVAQLDDFVAEDMHVEDFLTTAERQTMVRHELENIRAQAEDDHVYGYPSYALYEGQSVLQVCLKYEIITKLYPLHEEEVLKKLGQKWYLSLFEKQPVEEIRLYFGESVALYFVFLGFYTSALLIPVFLGFLQLLVSTETLPFFCIFNVVWVTVFLEIWKRRSNELAFKWGTIGMTSLDTPRANFRGTMGIDSVTGKVQPQHPRYITYLKMYAVSIPIVFVCMVGAFLLMLLSFWAEDYLKKSNEYYQQFVMLPSILYSILVFVVNAYYRKLATFLTEWENHRTQSQYDRHRVTKLVLFEFVNNFMSLFYIAFITKDMDMLRSQLQTMLIISQAINNFQEAVLPLALKYYSTKIQNWRQVFDKPRKMSAIKIFRDKGYGEGKKDSNIDVPQIQPDDPRIKQIAQEGDMEDYEGTYDDYLELFIQFGYVFLFSSVYPIAAFWAVLNNILEIRADAFKLCKVFQRPMSRRVKDIGAWQRAFEVLGALSILTNCGLLYLSPQVRKRGLVFNEVEWLLLFVVLEHFMMGLRYLIHIAIADKPEWVRIALAKRNYESKQALKFERSQKSKKVLTRKFKTVHGPHTYFSSKYQD